VLNEDYREMLQILLEEEVRFIVVGAYALGAHGFLRATGDIDIWIEPTAKNAKKVVQALSRFGAPLHNIDEKDFREEDIVFQIGVAPRRIDILTAVDGLEFQSAYAGSLRIQTAGLNIPVLSLQDLIKNKESTRRERDALDAKMLKEKLIPRPPGD
jgi:hypothetical protein